MSDLQLEKIEQIVSKLKEGILSWLLLFRITRLELSNIESSDRLNSLSDSESNKIKSVRNHTIDVFFLLQKMRKQFMNLGAQVWDLINKLNCDDLCILRKTLQENLKLNDRPEINIQKKAGALLKVYFNHLWEERDGEKIVDTYYDNQYHSAIKRDLSKKNIRIFTVEEQQIRDAITRFEFYENSADRLAKGKFKLSTMSKISKKKYCPQWSNEIILDNILCCVNLMFAMKNISKDCSNLMDKAKYIAESLEISIESIYCPEASLDNIFYPVISKESKSLSILSVSNRIVQIESPRPIGLTSRSIYSNCRSPLLGLFDYGIDYLYINSAVLYSISKANLKEELITLSLTHSTKYHSFSQ